MPHPQPFEFRSTLSSSLINLHRTPIPRYIQGSRSQPEVISPPPRGVRGSVWTRFQLPHLGREVGGVRAPTVYRPRLLKLRNLNFGEGLCTDYFRENIQCRFMIKFDLFTEFIFLLVWTIWYLGLRSLTSKQSLTLL